MQFGPHTDHSDQTVRVECMLTWERVELSSDEDGSATGTAFVCVYRDETIPQSLDVCLDVLGRLGRVIHFASQLFDVNRIIF